MEKLFAAIFGFFLLVGAGGFGTIFGLVLAALVLWGFGAMYASFL